MRVLLSVLTRTSSRQIRNLKKKVKQAEDLQQKVPAAESESEGESKCVRASACVDVCCLHLCGKVKCKQLSVAS